MGRNCEDDMQGKSTGSFKLQQPTVFQVSMNCALLLAVLLLILVLNYSSSLFFKWFMFNTGFFWLSSHLLFQDLVLFFFDGFHLFFSFFFFQFWCLCYDNFACTEFKLDWMLLLLPFSPPPLCPFLFVALYFHFFLSIFWYWM